MRWIGVLLLPPFGAGACFIVLMLASYYVISADFSWATSLASRRILDPHVNLLLVAYSVLAMHGFYVVFLALRAMIGRGAVPAHFLLKVILGAAMVVPVVIWGLSTPTSELQSELPVAMVMLGVPMVIMVWIAERVAFGARTPEPEPEPPSRWAGPSRR